MRLVVTPELLHAAWLQRRRDDWPAQFAEAMDHPLYRRLVRAVALGLAQQQMPRQRRTAAMRHPKPPSATPGIDRKRAAAGDTDD